LMDYLMKAARSRENEKVSGWIFGREVAVLAAWSTAPFPGMPE